MASVVDMADVDHAGSGAARRRRERRLRAYLRYARMSVAMALAEVNHHTAPQGQRTARARGEKEREVQYTAVVRTTVPPPEPELFEFFEEPGGARPNLLLEPQGPLEWPGSAAQPSLLEHLVLEVPALRMVDKVDEVLAERFGESLPQVTPQVPVSEHIEEHFVDDPVQQGFPQERISERIPELIVVSELVGIPQERNSEHIPEPIDVSELVGIPDERISERIPEPIVACELVGFSSGASWWVFLMSKTSEHISEPIVAAELVGIPHEQTSERIQELIVACEQVGFPQEQTSERLPELIVVPGLGVVDMNDSHAAEEALRILRQVAARRQAELLAEDVDEEEYEDEYEPPDWRPTRMCRAFLAGGTGLCPYGQRCTFAHHRSELHPRVRQPGPY